MEILLYLQSIAKAVGHLREIVFFQGAGVEEEPVLGDPAHHRHRGLSQAALQLGEGDLPGSDGDAVGGELHTGHGAAAHFGMGGHGFDPEGFTCRPPDPFGQLFRR